MGVKGRGNLDKLKGKLGADFHSAGLELLQRNFFAGHNEKKAAQALDHFYQAASKLRSSENEFNRRARPSLKAPSLMAYLRDPAQFAVLREFRLAQERLLDTNQGAGQRIIELVEKGIDVPARFSARIAPSPKNV